MVVGECIGIARRSGEIGCGQHLQVSVAARGDSPVGVRLSDGAGGEELGAGIFLAHESVEYPEVTPERRRIIAFGGAAHRSHRGLVHILGRGDCSAICLGEGEPTAGLVGPPEPIRPTRACSGRHRGDNGRVYRVREVDRPQPLLAREHAAIALRRVLGRRVRVGEIKGVGPGAADPHVGWTERLGHRAQPPVGEVERWAILVEVGAHSGGRVAALGFTARRSGGLRRRLPNFLVRLPEFAAGHLQHLDIVRLIALVDRGYALHGGRNEWDSHLILRLRHVRHDRQDERNARNRCFPKPGHDLSPIEPTRKLKLGWRDLSGTSRRALAVDTRIVEEGRTRIWPPVGLSTTGC